MKTCWIALWWWSILCTGSAFVAERVPGSKQTPSRAIVPLNLKGSTHEESWNRNMGQLKEYYEQHGTCTLPSGNKAYSSLTNFVGRIRAGRTALSEERRAQLEAMDFLWTDVKSVQGDTKWDQKFQKLVEYKATYGDCNVPGAWEGDPPINCKLGQWVQRQRRSKKQRRLSQHRIEKLESIGFVWSLRRSSSGRSNM